ncbi:MAG: ABC transporter substrate-binding protein, partial [Lachnospiraceae bacterium]|nr:ABC transporter substrate-binding protein [Lachnospiraceae bacterium]
VDTIEYIVVNETAQNVIGLQSGMLDVSQYVPTEDIARFEDGGESADIYDVRSVPVGEGYFITANCSDSSAFADENLRKAVYYAIDNEAIVTAVGGGMHACKAFASPIYADYVEAWENEETYFNTCDLELAKEYLAKSSYNGEKLVLLGCNDATYETILTVIQGCLLQLGVNVEIQALETAQVQSLSADKNSWDLYVVKYGGPSVIGAANKLVNWNEYNGEYALGFITDPDLQALYETAVTEATWNDDTMTDLFNHIVEHAYDYTLVYNDFNVVYNSDVNDIYVWDAYLLPHCFIYNLD